MSKAPQTLTSDWLSDGIPVLTQFIFFFPKQISKVPFTGLSNGYSGSDSIFTTLNPSHFSIKMKPGVWFWAVGGILSITTVLGNGLVIYLIISRNRLHNTINWFLLSLALADFCVGFVQFPSRACISASLCSKCITKAMQWLFLNLSMTNLCSLTVDRYIAMFKPLKYAVYKAKRRHLVLISAAWILPFVVHFVQFTWIYCTGMKKAVRNRLLFDSFTLRIQASSLSVIIATYSKACSKPAKPVILIQLSK